MTRLPALDKYDNSELLRLWAAVMRSLQDREVIRSSNNPVGDLCEGLVAAHFRVKPEKQSVKGYDVIAGGVRYQVKGRRWTAKSKPAHYSVVRGIDEDEFDYLIAVHLNEDFEVTEAWKVEHRAVKELAGVYAHVNGVRLPIIRGERTRAPGVERFELKLPC